MRPMKYLTFALLLILAGCEKDDDPPTPACNGCGGWNNIAPVLVSPVDGYVHQGNGNVVFLWRSVPTATSYHLSGQRIWQGDWVTVYGIVGIADTTISLNLLNTPIGSECRWRIRANNINASWLNGEWSEWWHYTRP